MTDARTPTAVDTVADSYLNDYAALDPIAATAMGIPGFDDRMPDLSPDGLSARADLRTRTLTTLEGVQPVDDNDKVTVAALRDQLTVAEQLRALGADRSDLNNIASPVQELRAAFDLMATDTAEDWSAVATRLAALPDAMAGYVRSLRSAADDGRVSARRQVQAAIDQCASNIGDDGFFLQFARGAAVPEGELPDSLRDDLERAASAASDAYVGLREYLGRDLLERAPEPDAFGRDEYAVWSRLFLGSTVDLEETYQWGQEELARITEDMQRTAERIRPGASVAEAIAELDADPDRKLVGTDALREWMQGKSDQAVAELAGTHFDIPDPIKRLECMIAPTHTGGIYYTGPSDDLTRPGRMWWSVPEGENEFSTWRELTTVYHEGVPGHHLQVAQTVYRRDILNAWRRLGSWSSGHGEGWALYAEKLMADLGYLDDPADYLGMLDGQSLRAARVVLDIGIHCGFDAPAEVGGGAWDYDKAWTFLTSHANMSEGQLRFELTRYLGWPGQAPSYKIGERLWLSLRDEVRASEGDSFDLAAFHRRALDIGGVGLDTLRGAVLGTL